MRDHLDLSDAEVRRAAVPDNDRTADQDARHPVAAPASPPVARRWRPVAAASAAVVVIAVGVTLATALGHGHRPTADRSTVPWKPLAAATATSGGLDTDTGTCDPAVLTVTAVAPEVVMGSFRTRLTVHNTGAACRIPDDEVGLLTDDSGQQLTLATVTPATTNSSPRIPASGTGDYYVTFDDSCTDAARDQQDTDPLVLDVSGTRLRADGASIAPALATCDSVALTPPPDHTDENDFPGLSVHVDLPDSTTGTTLDYSVTLTNTGTKPWGFRVCPTYRQVASVAGQGRTEETYTLNCADHRTLDPGASIDYAMELTMPAATGTVQVRWSLVDGPSSTGSLPRR
ncbi:MAG: hypothetical protein QM638_21385 [Nocardioides sp.]|uniref:hypothetical protein n=1 Tax=Nocardioides sp. TaxID=35761 RepID=UPI0039E33057